MGHAIKPVNEKMRRLNPKTGSGQSKVTYLTMQKIITNPWGAIIPQGPNSIHTIFTLRMQQVFKKCKTP